MNNLRKNEERATPALLFYITQVYVVVMLIGLPLFAGLGSYVTTEEDVFQFFTATSVTYLVVLSLCAAELMITGTEHFFKIFDPLKQLSRIRICFLAYLFWSILSAIQSPFKGVWIGLGRHEGLCEILLCVLVFWAISSYGQWDNLYLWLLGCVVTINGVLGLIQYAGGNPLGLFPEGTNYHDAFVVYNGQFMGTLGNVDILGAFLSLILPVFYVAYLFSRCFLTLLPLGAGAFLLALADVDAGYVGVATALFLTVPIYYTQRLTWSRGMTAVGVLLAGLGVGKLLYADRDTDLCLRFGGLETVLLLTGLFLTVLGMLSNRKIQTGGLSHSRLLWLALPVGILAGLAVLYVFPLSSGTLWEMQQMLHGNINPDFGSGRVRIWQEVIRLIGERPLLGGGPDTLVERMTFTFTRYSEELDMTIEAHVDAAHNLFLNTAVNQGLPALGFLLVGLAFWLATVMKQRRTAGLLILAGVIGYLVQGCFNVSLCSVTGLFWIFLALGECDVSDTKSIRHEGEKKK